ncbi:hypothetical protein P7K49_028795, partial [Saguinus oedipus]
MRKMWTLHNQVESKVAGRGVCGLGSSKPQEHALLQLEESKRQPRKGVMSRKAVELALEGKE